MTAEPMAVGPVIFDRKCEWRDINEPPACAAKARFRVSRGREYDAQDSCARHLARTVEALIGLEDRPVTVRRIKEPS